MGLLNRGRVNIVITNRVLRYTFHKNASLNSLVTYGEVELPEGTMEDGAVSSKRAIQKVVNRLVKKHKWKRKKLYFCVPDDTVVIRQLQIPAALTKDEALAYVKTQIGNSFYLPFENPAIAVELMDADDEYRDILLFAYPKEKLTAYEAIFEEAGLKPVAADLTSLSVYRYYYMKKYEEREHVLLVHWNHDALVLTAFQQHKAIFTRYMKIEASGEMNNESVKQHINEFVTEITRIIDFYRYSITKGEAGIHFILLTGDFPFLKSASNTLQETVDIPIHRFEEEELQAKYSDVLGLALKQIV